ncbi:MAG TPA: hypothetical protein DEB40_00265 [Elusimicrobia bacterium]|nr:hypothetical protein [Elusimicrobiota bacterium]HBT60165.1 hypothetical protein [Elusimicrobiota bacterium]
MNAEEDIMSNIEAGRKTAIHAAFWAAGLGLLALVVAAPRLNLSAQSGMRSAADIERKTHPSASARTAETIIRDWPERARGAARAMIEKYGKPNRGSADALVWYNNGPWQKTVVYRRAWPQSAATREDDFLEQTIAYQVPNDKINALKRFDPRLSVNKIRAELSCRSESESANFLALNLADEIVVNKRSVESARDFCLKTRRLARSGKTSPYLEGFLFEMFNDRSSGPEYPGPL